ncbi:TPA: hypothetical protein DCE37_05650 [Candidatus Latescibacteria bacterium]|nr:hypothetical protein [Candidatus Latescibacterota bacterium]
MRGRDFIVVSGVPFGDRWTSKQEIARILAREGRVLYVESVPKLWDVGALRHPFGRLWSHSDNLYVYTPPPLRVPLDFMSTSYNRLLQGTVAKRVRAEADRLGFKAPAVWLIDIRTSPYREVFPEAKVIYHCVDRWADLLVDPHCRKEVVLALERETVGNADIVTTSARDLQTHILESTEREAEYLPHGVDFNLFSQSAEPGPLHPSLQDVQGRVLGFAGTIGHWVDVELLDRLAKERPDYTLVLLGEIAPSDLAAVERICEHPNVSRIPPVPKRDLPELLRRFDVCLIPFLVNDFTDSINPLKLLEYLCSGKPIVTTNIREAGPFSDLAYVADSPDAFLDLVDVACDEDNVDIRQRRMDTASQHTWEARVELAMDLLGRG